MAVIIRCRKTGANNDPCFRIVATDRRSPRDGKYLEALGWYDPKKKENNFNLKLERIEVWLAQGAMISAMVKTLYNKAKRGIKSTTTKGKAEGVKKKKSAKERKAKAAAEAAAPAAPATAAKPAAPAKTAAPAKPAKPAATPPPSLPTDKK